MSDPGTREWFLLGTLGEGVTGVIARGHDPGRHEPFKQLKQYNKVLPLNVLLEFNKLVTACVASGQQQRRRDPYLCNGKWWGAAKPYLADDGKVHAVSLWIGTTPNFPSIPVQVAGWRWLLPKNTRLVVFGPGIPEMYRRPDWTVGTRYHMNELTSLIQNMALSTPKPFGTGEQPIRATLTSKAEVNEAIQRSKAGERLLTGMSVRRGDTTLGEIRSAMEVVHAPSGEVEMRGVSWEVSEYNPPREDPAQAAAIELAREVAGWTLTMVTRPTITLINFIGPRLEVLHDADTHRITLSADEAHIPRQVVAELDNVEVVEVDMHMSTPAGQRRLFRVKVSRIAGQTDWVWVRILPLSDDNNEHVS